MLGAAYHTIRRRAAGSYVDGIYRPGLESSTAVLGSIQPMPKGGREVELRQEGARVVGSYWLFTVDDTLVITDLTSVVDSDTLEYRGRDYKIFRDDDWTAHTTGLPHHSLVLVEVGMDEAGVPGLLLVGGEFLTVGGERIRI